MTECDFFELRQNVERLGAVYERSYPAIAYLLVIHFLVHVAAGQAHKYSTAVREVKKRELHITGRQA